MKRDKIVKMAGSGIDGSGPRIGYIARRGLCLNVTSCLSWVRCKRPECSDTYRKKEIETTTFKTIEYLRFTTSFSLRNLSMTSSCSGQNIRSIVVCIDINPRCSSRTTSSYISSSLSSLKGIRRRRVSMAVGVEI